MLQPVQAQNMAKLMYMHMLGYNTKFGHMECIELICSDQYADKRLGYLALMILLDETQEVLPLIEHSLKKDLDDKNQFVQSLALTACANIASHEICRDLSTEVEKLLLQSPYVRKKAALCAVRIVQKCPDLADLYVAHCGTLLKEHNHAVLLTAVTLMYNILESTNSPQYRSDHASFVKKINQLLPQLLSIFKRLLMSEFTNEHDIHGISDPFLQIKLLQLFRLLGESNVSASDAMNDLLAQAATNTEPGKTAANAILYECVNTILGIESEKGLRVLAVYQLSEFLGARDNNLRYVSLNTLKKVLKNDTSAVLRHLSTIIDCLKDHDVGIRKRAVDLLLQLVSTKNIKLLIQEFIEYLHRATDQEKQELTAKLSIIIEEYAPSIDWKVDTYMRILLSAAHYVPLHMTNKFIALLTHCTPSLQAEVTWKLYSSLRDLLQRPHLLSKRTRLVQVAAWTCGEYAHKCQSDNNIDASELVVMLHKILNRTDTNTRTKAYIVTALTKLSEHFSQVTNQVDQILNSLKSNPELELQLRSCEYSVLLHEPIGKKILSVAHPPIEIQEDAHLPFSERTEKRASKRTTAVESETLEGTLIEFDDITGGGGGEGNTTADSSTTQQGASSKGENASSTDILNFFDDLSGSGNGNNTATNHSKPSSGLDDFFDMQSAEDSTTSNPNRFITVFEKDQLLVELEVYKPDEVYSPEKTTAVAYFSNSNTFPLTSFSFQLKVPKYLNMKLFKASSNRIPGSSTRSVRQKIDLTNSKHGEKPLVLKYQIKYKQNDEGEFIVHTGTTEKF